MPGQLTTLWQVSNFVGPAVNIATIAIRRPRPTGQRAANSDGPRLSTAPEHNRSLAKGVRACENRGTVRTPRAVGRGQLFGPATHSSPELSTPMRIIPLGPHVVVRRMKAEEKTTGGIVLPDRARSKPRQGRVCRSGTAGSSKTAAARGRKSAMVTGCCSTTTPAPKCNSTERIAHPRRGRDPGSLK